MRSSSRSPSSLNRHSSTLVAFPEKVAKFVPSPSQVAPHGCGNPSLTSRFLSRLACVFINFISPRRRDCVNCQAAGASSHWPAKSAVGPSQRIHRPSRYQLISVKTPEDHDFLRIRPVHLQAPREKCLPRYRPLPENSTLVAGRLVAMISRRTSCRITSESPPPAASRLESVCPG